MTQSKSLIGIAVSLIIATLILLAGSQGSLSLQGLPLFAILEQLGLFCTGLFSYPLMRFKLSITLT